MTVPATPESWANSISVLLRTVFGVERFPVDIKLVAREISRQKFPDDPISVIRSDNFDRFEGALVPPPEGKRGWGIFYNNNISSAGRINFTLAHEFGHYLLHRVAYPQGFLCSTEDMATWESKYAQMESEANIFAATLLMPLDDFRSQIGDQARPTLGDLSDCAERYSVSLTAAVLRWLAYTERRAMLVVSKDGFILWARSSRRAWKSRLYYKTRNMPPIELPELALASSRSTVSGKKGIVSHNANVWLNEPCEESVLFSERHDIKMSLLHFHGQ